MKTAMQQLFDDVQKLKDLQMKDSPVYHAYRKVQELIYVGELIEQEQIHKSFDDGYFANAEPYLQNGELTAETGQEYYNEKFKQD